MPLLATLALTLALAPPGPASLKPIRVPPPPIDQFPSSEVPPINGRAWMVYSVDRESELASYNPDLRLAPASITKLMTALLTVENLALSNPVTISARADAEPIGYIGQPDVRRGEVWTVRNLLANILVQSGNDAAVALAEAVSGNLPAFIELMNARAVSLDMDNTTFRNPNGLDTSGHLSTARDLIRLGREALDHPSILEITRIKQISFEPAGRSITVTATNRLIGVFPGYFGLKTGDTAAARQVLLSYTETQHDHILTVILGSCCRRLATRDLVAWATTTLGPRDYFLAPIAGSDLALLFPDTYQPRLAAAGALDTGDPVVPEATPLTVALEQRFRELLPELLGGDRQ